MLSTFTQTVPPSRSALCMRCVVPPHRLGAHHAVRLPRLVVHRVVPPCRMCQKPGQRASKVTGKRRQRGMMMMMMMMGGLRETTMMQTRAAWTH